MIPDVPGKHRIIDTLNTLPIAEYPILVCKTRKTGVWMQDSSNPDRVLKRSLFFIEENPRNALESNIFYACRRYDNSTHYNDREKEKQKIVLPFVQGIENLVVPEESFFIGKGEDGYPEPYRLQTFQKGPTFDSTQDFWYIITPPQVEVIRKLIEADLDFYTKYGYHLDLIGFRSDHVPTIEEIAKVYEDPFPHASNLLFLSNGSIAWVDPKTSNLTSDKNLIRATRMKELLSRI